MAPLSRSVARATPAALGFFAALSLALPASAQPLDDLPDFLAPDLPPDLERLCGGAIVPEISHHAAATASAAPVELRLADPNITHVIDIAFVYDPDLRHSVVGYDRTYPYGVGQLRNDIAASIQVANVVFAKSNVNAELRFVGMEERATLRGLSPRNAIGAVQELLPYFRDRYGADLVYAVTRGELGSHLCGIAGLRSAGFNRNTASQNAATGSVNAGCFTPSFRSYSTLVHEVGHNLGLVHDIQDVNAGSPFVEYGRAYATRPVVNSLVYRGTIMATAGTLIPEFSSARRRWRETIPLGDSTADASRALLYTIEDASNYAPTKVRDPSPAASCTDSGISACLGRGRFHVEATYSVNGVEGQAKERDAMLGEDGAIFYFFDPGNPELLVKVVNGCWLNDHYWVFGSAATDLAYTIRIHHQIASGDDPERSATYHVQGGVIDRRRADGESRILPGTVIADTYAFPCSGGAMATAAPIAERPREELEPLATPARTERSAADRGPVAALAAARLVPARVADGTATEYGCFPHAGACLSTAGRFHVSAGVSGERYFAGETAALLGDNAALFFFFNPDNPELLLKVVDGCAINGHYWVFGSAATDLDYWVTVDDYASGRDDRNIPIRTNRYDVWGGVVYGSDGAGIERQLGVIADTFAFPCSP